VKINFDKCYQLYSRCYGKNRQSNPKFLTWLIGFNKGNEFFTIANRGDLYFIVTQDTRDKQVLEYIQKELNKEKVIIQGNLIN
jgi:hypothetical protein